MGEQKERKLRVLIAGGGTGGHLFPGLAIADALLGRRPEADIRFAGSNYGLEARVVPARGFRLYRIPVRGLYQVSWRRKLWVVAMLPLAFLRSLFLLLAFRPRLVIGVGGYASGPVMATALLLGRLTVLQEQNASAGLTNRLLGRFVRMAFLPFEGAEKIFPRHRVVGNPVRPAILALRDEPPAERPQPLLLVFGGSQGAQVLNRAICDALPLLRQWSAAGGAELRILHQTGEAELEAVRAAYQDSGLPHTVLPFIEDMADAFRRCRLVVGRAGASTVTEIVAARRPSVLVPIPATSGEHQLKNAQRIQAAGAGLLLEQAELSGQTLAEKITALLADPARLAQMERNCDTLFRGDAAAIIADACLQLVEEG